MAEFGPQSLPSSVLTMPEGIPDFKHALEERHRCTICGGVLREAMQTSCGHRYCCLCIFQLLTTGEPIKCPAAEEDCEDVYRQTVTIDTVARREISKLPVFCTYRSDGCSHSGPWRDLEHHKQTCNYRPVECTNNSKGCIMRLPLNKIEEHIQSECDFRNVLCKYCDKDVIFINIQKHENEECSGITKMCPNNCDIPEMTREDLQYHLQICPNQPVPCEYSPAGCIFTGTQERVQKHIFESANEHLRLMNRYVISIVNEKQKALKSLNDFRTLCDDLKRQLQESSKWNSEIVQMVDKLKLANKEMKLRIVSQTERIIHLERNTGELADMAVVQQHSAELRNAREKLEELKQKLVQFEGTGNLVQGTLSGTGHLSSMSDTVMNDLRQHDRQIGLSDIRLAELDMRSQLIETVTHDGILMWKIRDYRRRKKDAVDGKTLSLYSQPFYTSRYGYKLCARAYLNGDGMGRGNHLSLFFVLMRGEYDELLPWPFQQKVTLMLLDQGNPQGCLKDSFMPDPRSNSFQKPTSDMNTASGCPLFVSHTNLETSRYFKNDTLFIKIEVDTRNCHKP